MESKSKKSIKRMGLAVLLFVAMMLAAGANAATLSFDDVGLQHGSVVGNQYAEVAISAKNFNRSFDIAAAFDSGASNTEDSDLEAASGGATLWSGGNLQGTALGNMLILQENDLGCGDGRCDLADDEGSRAAGELYFDFVGVSVLSFGFDLIDVDDVVAEAGFVVFHDTQAGQSQTVSFTNLLNGLVVGDNTANRISPLSALALGLSSIDRVVFTLGGSGALDNITYQVVPEPTSLALVGLGLAGLAAHARRRRSHDQVARVL